MDGRGDSATSVGTTIAWGLARLGAFVLGFNIIGWIAQSITPSSGNEMLDELNRENQEFFIPPVVGLILFGLALVCVLGGVLIDHLNQPTTSRPATPGRPATPAPGSPARPKSVPQPQPASETATDGGSGARGIASPVFQGWLAVAGFVLAVVQFAIG